MTDGTMASSIYAVLMLMLVGSAFAARRVPIGRTLKMAAGWVVIFGLGLVVVGFRHDVGDLFGSRLLGRAVVSGGTVRIPMNEDGHFYIDARVNGNAVRLMVDSGATVTTLSRLTAKAAGVEPSGDLTVLVSTANGVMEVERARVASLGVGSITINDLRVHLAPNDDLDVLGMNFLSKLTRWSVEGRWLILTA